MADSLIRLLGLLEEAGPDSIHDLDALVQTLRTAGAVPAALRLAGKTTVITKERVVDSVQTSIWAGARTLDADAQILDYSEGWWVSDCRGIVGVAIRLEREPTERDSALLFAVQAVLDTQYLDSLGDEMGVVFVEFDVIQERFTHVSPKVEALFGYPAERWFQEGTALSIGLVHPDDLQGVVDASTNAMQSGQTTVYQFRAICADDSIRLIEARARGCATMTGYVTRSMMIDVTTSRGLPTVAPPLATRRPVVLIVEEEEVVRRVMRGVFEDGGYRVYVCSSLESVPSQHLSMITLVVADLAITDGDPEMLERFVADLGITAPLLTIGEIREGVQVRGRNLRKPFGAADLLDIANALTAC